jgi:hypothetical protein
MRDEVLASWARSLCGSQDPNAFTFNVGEGGNVAVGRDQALCNVRSSVSRVFDGANHVVLNPLSIIVSAGFCFTNIVKG